MLLPEVLVIVLLLLPALRVALYDLFDDLTVTNTNPNIHIDS